MSAKVRNPPRRKYSRNAELAPEKLDRVLDLLPLLYHPLTLERKVAAEFGVGTRQARRYIATARQEIRDKNSQTRNERREELRDTFKMLLRKATEADDPRTAVAAARELANLDGLNEPDRVEITGSMSVVETDPQRARERLDALRKAQG